VGKKLNINIPQRSVAYMLICLTGVLVFVLVGIIPMQRSLSGLDEDIKQSQFKIEEQRNLLPLYASLKKSLERKDKGTVLPFPKKAGLPKEQIGRIPVAFRDVARRANMNVVSISPELNSLSVGSQTMLVNMIVKGNFLGLRKLLVGLGSIAFVDYIEEIHVKSGLNSMEVDMKVRITLQ
jgi:hypothetical protein